MNGKWVVEGHHIAIEAGSRVFHPLASDVYNYLDDETISSMDPKCDNPSEELSLRFSKIGSPLRCRLWEDESSHKLQVMFYVSRKGKIVPVDIISDSIIDQCVSGNEWFYVTGETEEANRLLKRIGIHSNGKVSFHQYLDMVSSKLLENNSFIQNEVNASYEKTAIAQLEKPESLKANLYPYQQDGYNWLSFMTDEDCGCILGDEMGLGKTLQVIAVMTRMVKNGKKNNLVVAPVSLLENWRRECEKFSPELDVFVHHGGSRTGRYQELKQHDVVVISYNTAVSDLSMLKMVKWNLVIVDEAQNIKNYKSERAKAIKAIPRGSAIAVTGTPFENHITDIWSIVDFVFPDYFGSISGFSAAVPDDVAGAEIVEPLLSPIMLRRLVKDVAQDLPEKVVIPQPLIMSDQEAGLYEELRQSIAASGSQGIELSMLQHLRMFCTHPAITEAGSFFKPDDTVKYQRFCEIVEEIISRNEKVLVFTSYKKMFDIFKSDVMMRFGIPVQCINGETPVDERQTIVDYFNSYPGSVLLALNPRAAGTGLNITGANHVIHYNLEWNPALEDQASARAYRRGQEHTVFVYRLFYKNTIEDIVNDRIERKRDIAESAVVGIDGREDNRRDIIAALNISPIK